MAGVMLEPDDALSTYGIDATAIQRATGGRITIWRESQSAQDAQGNVAEHLIPHLIDSPAKYLDPTIIRGFSIYVEYDPPDEDHQEQE